MFIISYIIIYHFPGVILSNYPHDCWFEHVIAVFFGEENPAHFKAWGTRGPTPAEGGHQTPLDIPTINAAQSNPIHPILPYKTHPRCSQICVNPLLDHGFWVMFI